jgi:hypothetical protein
MVEGIRLADIIAGNAPPSLCTAVKSNQSRSAFPWTIVSVVTKIARPGKAAIHQS